MSKTAQWVIDLCEKVVVDSGTKWGDSWIPFINSGQMLIADIFPSAVAVTTSIQLSPGVDQTCPAGATRFLGMTNNQGVDGNTPGDVIFLCDEDSLSAFNPSWMATTPATTVENFMFNENEPTNFMVYPPVHDTTAVYAGIQYATAPTDCVGAYSNLGVPDRFAPALAEWCLYMALSAETDARDPAKANNHLNNFFNLLNIKTQNRIKYSPNVQDRAGTPPTEARA